MLKHIDEFGEEIRKRMEKDNKKNLIINVLREMFYNAVNSITFTESLSKGKIPTEIRENVLYIIGKELGMKKDDLGYFFDKSDIELGEILQRLNNIENDYKKIKFEIEEIKRKK